VASLENIHDYLRQNATELGERILSSYPALHRPEDLPSPLLDDLLRRPFPAQTLAIMDWRSSGSGPGARMWWRNAGRARP
jgi:hypothetical protein